MWHLFTLGQIQETLKDHTGKPNMRKVLIKRCLKQLFRPALYIKGIVVPGEGDCDICQPAEENKNCISYCPISIETFDIEEKI